MHVDGNARVIVAENHLDMKHASFIHATLRPRQRAFPDVHIGFAGCKLDVAQVLSLDVGDFFLDTLEGCLLPMSA